VARSEARITVDIWDVDSDFTGLTRRAQGTYFFLLSQPDLAHTGVLGLRMRRWASAAADLTEAEVLADLDELAAAEKVVLDFDTEELLVRALIRRDKVFRQPNVLRSAADTLPTVRSRSIRFVLAEELRRIQKLEMPKDSGPIIAQMLEAIGNPYPEGRPNPSATPSGNPSTGTPGERGVVRRGSSDSPIPESPSPNTSPPGHVEAGGLLLDGQPIKAPAVGSDEDPKWVEFWTAFPRRDGKADARKAFVAAVVKKKIDPDVMIAGAARYAQRMRREQTEPSKVKMAQGWINGERWADEPAPATAPDESGWWDN
jgi:hypothetical protein